MQQGDFEQAIACFREAWDLGGLVAARNNWATALYHSHRPAEALQVLDCLLEDLYDHPYSHALASLCWSALGNTERARNHLKRAIRGFDAGLANLAAHPDGGKAWVEYTVAIKHAAGNLGDHRLVLDLHSRWPGRDLPRGTFLAGVAAFNLEKYARAVRIWQRVRDPEWQGLLWAYSLVAEQTERGVIPPFPLDYELPKVEGLQDLTPEEADRLPVEGGLRVILLAAAFDQAGADPSSGSRAVAEVIRRTGDWGIELGRRLLRGATVPMSLKMGAAQALTELGVFPPGEPIPAVVDGRPTQIVVRTQEVAEGPIPELEAVVEQARQFWEEGQRDAALKLLTDLHEGPVFYPPAALLEAYFLREQGRRDEALALVRKLEELMPDQPSVLLLLAVLHLDQGDVETARHYAEAIDPTGMPPAFRRDFERVMAALDRQSLVTEDLDTVFAAYQEFLREQVDEKPITLNMTLATALRRIPVQWLNAAAGRFAIPPQRRRPEREKALAAAMLNRDRLRAVLADEPPAVREALAFVLAEGGWVKLQRLTHRFGDQAGDGFYWDEHPPTSPLGRLRALGLVHVGRALVGGRRHKVAVVPAELRPLLQSDP